MVLNNLVLIDPGSSHLVRQDQVKLHFTVHVTKTLTKKILDSTPTQRSKPAATQK